MICLMLSHPAAHLGKHQADHGARSPGPAHQGDDLPGPMRTWILFEAENVPVHLPADLRIELAEVRFGGGSDFNAVGQDSVPKFPHKVTE